MLEGTSNEKSSQDKSIFSTMKEVSGWGEGRDEGYLK